MCAEPPSAARCSMPLHRAIPLTQRAQQAVEQLQALNPNVRVQADTDCVEDKEDAFFTQFSAVCVTCCARASLLHINAVCRAHGVKFFCGDVWGFYGYFFSDLGQHEFAV